MLFLCVGFPSGNDLQERNTRFILNHPRVISTQLFSPSKTVYLSTMLLAVNLLQFILHVVSTDYTKELEVS